MLVSSPVTLPFIPWRQALSLSLEFTVFLARLAGQLVRVTLLSLPPTRLCTGVTATQATPSVLHGCWGSKFRSSHLHRRCVFPLNTLPSPKIFVIRLPMDIL